MKKLSILLIICLALFGWLLSVLIQPQYIDLEPTAPDQGTLSKDEYETFRSIIGGAEQLEHSGDPCRLITHLGMYYGNIESEILPVSGDTITVNREVRERLEQERVILDTRIEEAVRNIRDGSDRCKLRQIARYISRRMTYSPNSGNALDGLNGEGVCLDYAMLFYKMATRIGIQTYICFGYTGEEYHAWNMVEIDGKQYFYDVTRYDSLPLPMYLHNPANWGRSCVLNDLWKGAKQ